MPTHLFLFVVLQSDSHSSTPNCCVAHPARCQHNSSCHPQTHLTYHARTVEQPAVTAIKTESQQPGALPNMPTHLFLFVVLQSDSHSSTPNCCVAHPARCQHNSSCHPQTHLTYHARTVEQPAVTAIKTESQQSGTLPNVAAHLHIAVEIQAILVSRFLCSSAFPPVSGQLNSVLLCSEYCALLFSPFAWYV